MNRYRRTGLAYAAGTNLEALQEALVDAPTERVEHFRLVADRAAARCARMRDREREAYWLAGKAAAEHELAVRRLVLVLARVLGGGGS